MLTLSKNEQRREQARKAAGLASVALAAAVCLSGASIYWRHWNEQITTELSDATALQNGEGLTGYLLIDEVMDWDRAALRCREEGLILATISSDDKVSKALAVSLNQPVWIGYRNNKDAAPDSKEEWNWISGAESGFDNWADTQPDNVVGYENEKCAEMRSDGKWNNLKCQGLGRKVLCDNSAIFGQFAVQSVGSSDSALTFDEADSKCRELYNTGLASFSDGEYLQRLISNWAIVGEMWVGLRVKPGTAWAPDAFTFSDGANSEVTLVWAADEPNNAGDGSEYCVEVSNEGSMSDVSCAKLNRNYLCDTLVGGDVFDSQFEYMSEKTAESNWQVPSKIVDYNGRRKYSIQMQVRINAVNWPWRNFFFVGTETWARMPGFWLRPYNTRRLHIRQRSKEGWSQGCDTEESQTPALHQWFDLELYAEPGSFQVKIAGVSICSKVLTFDPYPGRQKVWMGRWSPTADVSMRRVRLEVSNE